MEFGIWLLLAAAAGYGVLRFARSRSRRASERQARADKRAKTARDDAAAIRRTLAGRR